MRLLLLVVFPALRCAALATTKPSRLRRAWRAVSRRRPPAPDAPEEPASAAAPVSTLARTTSLSDAFWEALDGTRVDESSAARNKRVAFRVRPAERWVVERGLLARKVELLCHPLYGGLAAVSAPRDWNLQYRFSCFHPWGGAVYMGSVSTT